MGYFDDNEDRIIYGRGRRAYCRDEDPDDQEELRCKRCGSTDVRWRHQAGKWTLFSLQPGVLHLCGGPAPAPASDFEPVE